MLQNRKKFFTLSGGLLTIAIFLVVITTILSGTQKNSQLSQNNAPGGQTNPQPLDTNSPNNPGGNSLPFPKIQVNSWEGGTTPIKEASSARIYSFKPNDSLSAINALSQSFIGTTPSKQKNGQYIGFTSGIPSGNDISFFVGNIKTGEFSYASTTGITLPSAVGGPVSENAQVDAYVKTLALDPTLDIQNTYQKKNKDGVTYYEIHRNWEKAGLPILNALGLLNTSPNQKLANLALGSTSDKLQDPNIYRTSDGTDGLARTNDFNTMTIGVNSTTKKIVSLVSNIRFIQNSKLQTIPLLSYQEAVAKLKSNQYEALYTSPTGTGVPSFNKVYPGNHARANQAQITDSILTYLENPPALAQTHLTPYYLFRGNTQLDSGYEVNFIALVPAQKVSTPQAQAPKSKAPFEFIKSVIAQAITNTPNKDCSGGQCQGSYQVTPAPTVPVVPTLEVTDIPAPTTPSSCIPAISDLTNISAVSDTLKVGQLSENAVSRVTQQAHDNAAAGDWYSYSTTGKALTADDLVAAQNSVTADRKRQIQRLEMQPLMDKLLGVGGPDCPVRITGNSPTIFVYGPAGSSFAIKTSSNQNYANPANSENTWNVTIGRNNILGVNGTSSNYLYYEYKNVTFQKPTQGWIVRKDTLSTFSSKIASQLGLNTRESQRLLFELQNAAESVKSNALFIGQILRSEVDAKLPLGVTGTNNVIRIHFYVGKGSVQTNSSPSLTPIVRTTSLVLELGATAGE